MNEKTKYVVEIFGEKYSLVSDEPSEHLLASAQLVDVLMKEISHKLTSKDVRRIAVLAALHIASDLLYYQKNLRSKEEDVEKMVQRQKDLLALVDREMSNLMHS